MRITGILLAAGHSRRFTRGNKLLQPLQADQPTAAVSAHNLITALPDSLAITRPEVPELAELMSSAGLRVLTCQAHEQEMADSLAVAVRHVSSRNPPPDAIVIALADMPFIHPQTIASIRQQLETDAGIVVPTYQQQRGHPVGFNKRFFAELADLNGDEGARSILRRHAQEIHFLECNDPGILQDIDTWEDMERLSSS
ncbi:nucleotidyltransferase family protein [Methylobacillus caricis]|uniref:nucleotidyltransferase family protein n=1 Tax=Methylobacillus caricis TaxID=1971611 RepID=UPI001CFFA14A|nr:nucleotidyltransferase family protein [Methylobacillus caricis]MCB5188928.1 nucleotidyltransferase family protein [Methylobacillus caricis]